MSPAGLIDRARVEIRLGEYGVAPATALSDPGLAPRVQEYRRLLGARMQPLGREEISERIPAAEYHVSRKVDGEFAVLVLRDGELVTLNPGGTVRVGLPWEGEARKLLAAAGVREAMLAGELYATCPGRRPRVHDVITVARQPQSIDDLKRLRFAVFDIISLDGEPPRGPFGSTWETIQRIFGRGETVHPVEARLAQDAPAIEKLFEQWVEREDAEGLVVRSDAAGLFKIKPRHSLDAVVVGFTESTGDRQGLLHDLLLAVMRQDGTLHILSRVGGGFSDDERRTLLGDLKDMVVDSEYAEVNSDHVAYQMVEPSWIIEISCLDLVSQTTRGGPVNRMVLEFTRNGKHKYEVVRRLPLAAVISPQFVRRREDKAAHPGDVRIQQVSDRVEVQLADRDARQLKMPASELLRREVYTKLAKGETMVRKFTMWRTNKQAHNDQYPAFVVHYTDFSPNRLAPLERDLRVSDSREQIVELWTDLKETHVKKGWSLHSAWQVEGQETVAGRPVPAALPAAAGSAPAGTAEQPAPAVPAKMSPSARRRGKSGSKKTG